ncbi:MAG: ferritin-like domain-containing protein [Candidatus Hydrothermia bacterium]|nr:ferritin-like domain-containing protein [Candidatus Hydrothermia bacterium]
MEELINALNEDLAFEYSAIIQYITYSAIVKEFFINEVNDELEHAKFLADKITALGGKPIITPKPLKLVENPKEMIEELLKAEEETIERYKKHIELAQKYNQIDIKVQLENIIVDESKHKDELKKILKNIGG